MIEFDHLAGLQSYLDHADHKKLGELFYRLQDSALVYDIKVTAEWLRYLAVWP